MKNFLLMLVFVFILISCGKKGDPEFNADKNFVVNKTA